jgi:hypothetical protein
MHANSEEPLLTPWSSPTVTSDPVLSAILRNTPAYNSDFVVNLWPWEPLFIDSAGIVLELVGRLNSTANWPVLVDLRLHLNCAGNWAVLSNVIEIWLVEVIIAFDKRAVGLAVVPGWRWSWMAGLANLGLVAGEVVVPWVRRLILLTCIVWDSVVMTELIDTTWVPTVAVTSGMAVDDHLWAKRDPGESVLPHDVDTIRQRAGWTMRPAAAAVLRDMLVTSPGEIVDTIHIPPVPSGREH